jgi:hypothetical protein
MRRAGLRFLKDKNMTWVLLEMRRLAKAFALDLGCEGAHNVGNSPKTLMRAAVPRTHSKTASRGVFCE